MRGSKASTFQIVCFEMVKLCRTHQPQAPAPLPQKKKEEKEKNLDPRMHLIPFFSLFLSFPPYFNLFVVVVVCCCFFTCLLFIKHLSHLSSIGISLI